MEKNFTDIKDFFSYLLDVPSIAWRFHLATDSYAEHKALDSFYSEFQDHTDSLVESYMGKYGKLGFLEPVEYTIPIDAVSFLEELLDVISESTANFTEFSESSELQSIIDNMVSLIDSTIYQLKNLK